MKELINEQSIDNLKKRRTRTYIYMFVSLLIALAIIIPLIFLARRETRYWFVALLTLIAAAEASFILYLCVVSLTPLNNYIKQCQLSLTGNKYETKGVVVSIADKITHYKGIAVRIIRVKDSEEENKEYSFYIEQNQDGFLLGKKYTFITYQSIITSYEEDL